VIKPVLVSRRDSADGITVFSSRCPHLGCTVRWDGRKSLFLCACHGGVFHPDGRVKAGPPPRPLQRYPIKVKDGELLVWEA
jgi:Rieske Fe-S protein